MKHQSAKPSHYDKDAKYYDKFNEKKSIAINQALEEILQNYKVKTILDLTCGTGSQVFWLAKRGYEVHGLDFNENMLRIARRKARKEKINVIFLEGDVRNAQVGKFDAALTIFNAVGHLTKNDFEKAMQNISQNLNENGLYIFDIFNLSFLKKKDHITSLTIDWMEKIESKRVRAIQYSAIDEKGILVSYTTSYEQERNASLKIAKSVQTLQIYSAKQLEGMLQRNGFKVVQRCNVDGSRFVESKSDRILTVAKKI